MDHPLDLRIEQLTHPLTRVVLTSPPRLIQYAFYSLRKIQRPGCLLDQSRRPDGRSVRFTPLFRLRRRLLLDPRAEPSGHFARCFAAGVAAGADGPGVAESASDSADARRERRQVRRVATSGDAQSIDRASG